VEKTTETVQAAPRETRKESTSSAWPYYLGGVTLLALVAGLIVFRRVSHGGTAPE
jgi:hypothetical protein